MELKFKNISLLICSVVIVAISACSGQNGNEPYTLNIETDSEKLTTLGEFPVGIKDYVPPIISISSPSPANPISTVFREGEPCLREIIKDEKWVFDIIGKFEPARFGPERRKLDFKGLYVNLERVDESNGDYINWGTGEFRKAVYVTKEDIARIFYPVTVAAVDEKGYIAGARVVFILQEGNSISSGDQESINLRNAIHLIGNRQFVENTLSLLIAQINGMNLAGSVGYIGLPGYPIITPRTLMLQGLRLNGYKIVEDRGIDGCLISLDLNVDSMVAEFTNKLSIFTKKGQNIININARDLRIAEGFLIEIKKDNSNNYTVALTAKEINLIKGETFKYHIDTPFTEIINYLLDNMASFFGLVLKIEKPVQLNPGFNIIKLLLKQLSRKEISEETKLSGIRNYSIAEQGISFDADVDGLSTPTWINSTYRSKETKADSISLDLKGHNSTIALSDDFINRILAMNFVDNPLIKDPFSENWSSDDDDYLGPVNMNSLIDQLNVDLGDLEIWPWLRNDNGELPNIIISFSKRSPPIMKLDGSNGYIGNIYLRDIWLEVYSNVSQSERDIKKGELLARLSVDFNIRVKWDQGKFIMECNRENYSYTLLYNKLYPLFLPAEMNEIPQYIANSLNSLASKLGLSIYENITLDVLDKAYLVANGDLKKQLGYTNSKLISAHEFSEALLSSAVGIGGTAINREAHDSSIAYNSKSGDVPMDSIFWIDSHAYIYKTSNENELISGISFDAADIFDHVIGRTLEFYEEFATISIVSSPSGEDQEAPVAYDSNSTSFDSAFIPRNGYQIPFEYNVCDRKIQGLETGPGLWNYILTYSENFDFQPVPGSRRAGLGLRIKKNPRVPLTMNITGLREASMKNIKIYWIDLNLDLGMNFTKTE